MDIDGEPLFEEKLANQTAPKVKPKHKSKRTKAYTSVENKLLCECWRGIGQDLKVGAEQKYSALWTRVHCEFHEHKMLMNAFMKIQRRRLEMDAEKQAKMLELKEAKQAKMLEIEAANAKTKAKEVALANMKTGVEIMKVDLNTVSPRTMLWFEKMQAEMLKFDQL
ncbi:Eyes absent-like protein 4 [Hordeum vulgare]|nr:Eyes absent-like protein 4 [Hordeum vulgare]